MASITIRNLEHDIKKCLRIRAEKSCRSMEEEAREILRHTVADGKPKQDLAAAIRARIAPFWGVYLDLPNREAMRELPAYDRAWA